MDPTGRPVPRVTWYEDGRPVESRVEYLPTRQIRSVLAISELGRANHGVRYSCAASNSRILPPLVATVTVMMRRKLRHFFKKNIKLIEYQIKVQLRLAVSSSKTTKW